MPKKPMTVAEAGRLGGLKGGPKKSKAKTLAARRNAIKGGRPPRKQPAEPVGGEK